EDQRQPERDQEVVGAGEKAVEHLLEDENELHASASYSNFTLAARCARRDVRFPPSEPARRYLKRPAAHGAALGIAAARGVVGPGGEQGLAVGAGHRRRRKAEAVVP